MKCIKLKISGIYAHFFENLNQSLVLSVIYNYEIVIENQFVKILTTVNQ